MGEHRKDPVDVPSNRFPPHKLDLFYLIVTNMANPRQLLLLRYLDKEAATEVAHCVLIRNRTQEKQVASFSTEGVKLTLYTRCR